MQRRARVGDRRSIRSTIPAAMVRDDAQDVRGQRRADEHALRAHLRRGEALESCAHRKSCAWGVIFGSTARRSRRRSPAGRRRRRRPRGMRIGCARSRCVRCTSGGARRAAGSRFLASASDAPRSRARLRPATGHGGMSLYEHCGHNGVRGVAGDPLVVSHHENLSNDTSASSGEVNLLLEASPR